MNEKRLELKVGLFVLIGLTALMAMVIHFGRLGEGLKNFYELKVEFPNASGLLKGSVVLYGGAQIGRVADHPQITNAPQVLEERTGVVITLKIFEDAKIPEGSRFIVGSSGLLGDRFVDVTAPEKIEPDRYIQPGTLLAGTRVSGIEDITREGTELIKDLRNTVSNIDAAIQRVDKELLKEENMQAFETTMKNLQKTSEDISEIGPKLDDIVDGAKGAMTNAEQAMKTAEEAMVTGKYAIEDIRKVVEKSGEAIDSTKQLIQEGLQGKGVLGQLVSNQEMAEELETLITNLRKHGILFYRDRSEAPEDKPHSRVKPPRAAGRGHR